MPRMGLDYALEAKAAAPLPVRSVRFAFFFVWSFNWLGIFRRALSYLDVLVRVL